MKRKKIMNILRLSDPARAMESLPLSDRQEICEVIDEMRDIASKFAIRNGYDPVEDLSGAYSE